MTNYTLRVTNISQSTGRKVLKLFQALGPVKKVFYTDSASIAFFTGLTNDHLTPEGNLPHNIEQELKGSPYSIEPWTRWNYAFRISPDMDLESCLEEIGRFGILANASRANLNKLNSTVVFFDALIPNEYLRLTIEEQLEDADQTNLWFTEFVGVPSLLKT